MSRLVLSAEALAAIHAHLEAAGPEERCGLLVGEDRGGARRVRRAVPVENAGAHDRAHRYEIAPERFLEEEKRARGEALEVVGFFHSHPSAPPVPSAFDRERAWPHYSYLIATVERGRVTEIACWRLGDGRAAAFEPEEWGVEVADA